MISAVARRYRRRGGDASPPAAGIFGEDDSAGVSLGLGMSNLTDCEPFSTMIERKPIPRTCQPSFSWPTRSRNIASASEP
jgi:hypothetical protein